MSIAIAPAHKVITSFWRCGERYIGAARTPKRAIAQLSNIACDCG